METSKTNQCRYDNSYDGSELALPGPFMEYDKTNDQIYIERDKREDLSLNDARNTKGVPCALLALGMGLRYPQSLGEIAQVLFLNGFLCARGITPIEAAH